MVIVFNGNAGHRGYRIPLAQSLSRQGLAVLLFDYRGYGGNPGSPTESGLIEDARAVLQYALSRDDVDPDKIVYFGESLGAAVAVALAVESSSGRTRATVAVLVNGADRADPLSVSARRADA